MSKSVQQTLLGTTLTSSVTTHNRLKALAKIFGEDAIQNITTPTASLKRKSIKSVESKSNIQLKQTDYQTIKNMFERVMKRQEEMDQKLFNHKEDLKTLGKALDSAININ